MIIFSPQLFGTRETHTSSVKCRRPSSTGCVNLFSAVKVQLPTCIRWSGYGLLLLLLLIYSPQSTSPLWWTSSNGTQGSVLTASECTPLFNRKIKGQSPSVLFIEKRKQNYYRNREEIEGVLESIVGV